MVKSQIQTNLDRLLPDIRTSGERRDPVSLNLVKDWHTRMLDGIPVAEPAVAGGFRGSGPPRGTLRTCSVIVGRTRLPGAAAGQVRARTREFARELTQRVAVLDGHVAPKTPAGDEQEGVVLELLAWAHGEWIRIHPFANGNGRTARAWVLWGSVRYGLPVFLTLRPRPRGGVRGSDRLTPYEQAATASMSGRHQRTQLLFTDMLAEHRTIDQT